MTIIPNYPNNQNSLSNPNSFPNQNQFPNQNTLNNQMGPNMQSGNNQSNHVININLAEHFGNMYFNINNPYYLEHRNTPKKI
jgi:hypothetical protein